ncbi:hypothetical protein ACFWDI_14465 [Streptomyces sp. NPDC060064]|uniref:hypothetical protein n=1 Tax=Streptomyces sp. NPDC060064 TaxID=3347049 RepID=UPI0036B6C65B
MEIVALTGMAGVSFGQWCAPVRVARGVPDSAFRRGADSAPVTLHGVRLLGRPRRLRIRPKGPSARVSASA